MTTANPPLGPEEPGRPTSSAAVVTELKRGAVGIWDGVFQSFSFVGPAGGWVRTSPAPRLRFSG